MLIRTTGLILMLLATVAAAGAELVAGPMPGYAAMRAAKVWVQTDGPVDARLRYWPATAEPDDARLGPPVATTADRAYTATLRATGLEPGTKYRYEVLLDGSVQGLADELFFQTQPLWQWRDNPPSFSFALGSCAYVNESSYDRPGEPYGGDYRIFDAIAAKSPDFMLWLGDNVYYREADWDARSSMYARYSHTRQLPALQRLLRATHHLATWDDHDYGPNNSDRSFARRNAAFSVFQSFWPNPEQSGQGAGGVATSFRWHDAAFFLLDNRYFRQANGRVSGSRTILGKSQIDWLLDALKSSKASFRFVVMGGQFLNSAEVFETYANIAPGERRRILDRIRAENIPGVVFLSGDRHHSVLLKKERRGTYPLYDWTVSPLTAGAGTPVAGEGQYRVDGSVYTERNFGVVRVLGPKDDRRLELSLHDSDGRRVWEFDIRQRDLR